MHRNAGAKTNESQIGIRVLGSRVTVVTCRISAWRCKLFGSVWRGDITPSNGHSTEELGGPFYQQWFMGRLSLFELG